jgi:D-aminoacyl-tRNA deacylase
MPTDQTSLPACWMRRRRWPQLLSWRRSVSWPLWWCLVSCVDSMRLVIQRVHSASVTVDRGEVARIGPGILALVGLEQFDTIDDDLTDCCRQLIKVKLWENDTGKPWRQSVVQKNYEILLVSQFTLCHATPLSTKSKFTPDYKAAMKSAPAQMLFDTFCHMVAESLPPSRTQRGVFGSMMDVSLVNDGPVTLVLDSRHHGTSRHSNHGPEDQELPQPQQGGGGGTAAAVTRSSTQPEDNEEVERDK